MCGRSRGHESPHVLTQLPTCQMSTLLVVMQKSAVKGNINLNRIEILYRQYIIFLLIIESVKNSYQWQSYHSSPWASTPFMFPIPPYFCHTSCIRSVPSPVLLSSTGILPCFWSVPSLSSFQTHIFKPHMYGYPCMNPSTLQIKVQCIFKIITT